MPIIDSGITDNIENAKTGIRQGVRYLIEQKRVKILKFGITNQPQKQLKQFELDGSRYNHMFLIYKTSIIADLKIIIDYVIRTYPKYSHGEMKHEDERYGKPPYFLYCVTYIPKKL
jgi:hypothetical protein